jgi:protein gp37
MDQFYISVYNGFDFELREHRLEDPLQWRKPSMVFVGSMTDLFYDQVPDDHLAKVFETMARASHHTFQILTKRADRMVDWVGKHVDIVPNNVWVGVTVENQDYVSRIEKLVEIPAKVRFVSFEPLLSEVVVPDYLMEQIQWAIVGGETGHRARRMEEAWAIGLRDQCKRNGVPFFFKHMGMFNADGERVGKKRAGALLDGKEWREFPVSAAELGLSIER